MKSWTFKRGIVVKLATCVVVFLLGFYIFNTLTVSYIERTTKMLFLASIPRDLSEKPVTSEATCRCNRTVVGDRGGGEESTCDSYASLRGYGQKVISFSLYGQLLRDSNFFKGIRMNLMRILEIYPGWVVRVYHSGDTADEKTLTSLCQLWCQFPHLDLCQVGRLPPPLGDQSKVNGMIWRFFTLGDPLVERFMIRDLDSVVGQREAAAVSEWIMSNCTWHFMHDHPLHNTPILGGMWGGVNNDLQVSVRLRQQLIDSGYEYTKGTDQILLTKYLRPIAELNGDLIDHNSYFCRIYFKKGLFFPWPLRRTSELDYVGRIIQDNIGITRECPEKCRPKDHQDWTFC